jgi:hypothetical protein
LAMTVSSFPFFYFYFSFFGRLGLELRASSLLGRCSITGVSPPALFSS